MSADRKFFMEWWKERTGLTLDESEPYTTEFIDQFCKGLLVVFRSDGEGRMAGRVRCIATRDTPPENAGDGDWVCKHCEEGVVCKTCRVCDSCTASGSGSGDEIGLSGRVQCIPTCDTLENAEEVDSLCEWCKEGTVCDTCLCCNSCGADPLGD